MDTEIAKASSSGGMGFAGGVAPGPVISDPDLEDVASEISVDDE